MKIALASDIHLEFGPIVLENTENADVLILSGDICVAAKFGPDYDAFFQDVSKAFPHVVYVMGNHEHYSGDFPKTASILKAALERYKNIHVLDRECWEHDGVTFIGSTLWTDFNGGDELTMRHIRGMMNDFRTVTNSSVMVSYNVPIYETESNGRYIVDEKGSMKLIRNEKHTRPSMLSPDDVYQEHKNMLEYIRLMTEGKYEQKFVIVGHHSPSKASTHPRYKHETLMNGAYSSDLDQFIIDHPQIKLWTHGHTHEVFDYMIGSTRIVCNPRGYHGYEPRASEFQLKILDL